MRILIIKPSSLGDIIQGLQVAQAIRDGMGDVHISWVVRDLFTPMVEACPAIDRIYVFKRKEGVKGYLALVRKLREEKFDVVLDMQGLFRSALMARLVHAKKRFMYPMPRELAGIIIPQVLPLPPHPPGPHAVEVLMQFLPALQLPRKTPDRLELKVPPIRVEIEAILMRKPVLMFPDSRRAEKEWPYFTELTRLLLNNNPGITVLWAGAGRREAHEFDSHARFMNLSGRTTMQEMIALIQGARYIIANDSGPMHLATAVGKPLLALFGPTNPERFGPYPLNRRTHSILQAPDGDLKRLTAEKAYSIVAKALKANASDHVAV